jgi:hypothetical protein
VENLAAFLKTLTHDGVRGRITDSNEQMRRIIIHAITGGKDLPAGVLKNIAKAIEQPLRSLQRVVKRNLDSALNVDANDADAYVTLFDASQKPRKDKRADDPLIREFWHAHCEIKKGKDQQKRIWLPVDKRTAEEKFELHDKRIQPCSTREMYNTLFLKWDKYAEWKERNPHFKPRRNKKLRKTARIITETEPISYDMVDRGRCDCIQHESDKDGVCVCTDHTSMSLKCDALDRARRKFHADCDCGSECSACWDSVAQQRDHTAYFSPYKNLSALSDEYMCDANDGEARKRRCAFGQCGGCGMASRMKCCHREVLEEMDVKYKTWTNVQHKLEWSATQELRYDVKPIAEFMLCMSDEFDGNYRAHNFTHKWQGTSHKDNLKHAHLVPGMGVVECDYMAKHTHTQGMSVNSHIPKQSSGEVYIIHHSFREDGSHITDNVQIWSDDVKQDPHVHWRNMELVVAWVEDTYKDEPFWKPWSELHVWTDGCAEQYKGHRNFRFLSAAKDNEFWSSRFSNIVWNFAASHHFAGVWDGEGGHAKTHCDNAREEEDPTQELLLPMTVGCVAYLNRTFTRTTKYESRKDEKGFVWGADYSINRRHFIHRLSGDDARKTHGKMEAKTVNHCRSHYQYRADPQSGYLLIRQFSCYCICCITGRYLDCDFKHVTKSGKYQPRAQDNWARVKVEPVQQRGDYELRQVSEASRESFARNLQVGNFIGVYCNSASGDRYWVAQCLAKDKNSNKVMYECEKGKREWNTSRGNKVLNIQWMERPKPSEQPLVFKAGSTQQILLSTILPKKVMWHRFAPNGEWVMDRACDTDFHTMCDTVKES